MTDLFRMSPIVGEVVGRPGYVDVAMIRHPTPNPRAVLVSTDGNRRRAMWLPLALVEVACRETDELEMTGGVPVIVTMPEWMARQRGLN